MRWTLPILVMLVLAPRLAHSRLDPLQQLTLPPVTPEVVLVLDLSGSMQLPIGASTNTSYASGSDCGGDRAGTVDLDGDGMCSGLENSSTTSDCTASNQACQNNSSAYSKQVSRMYLAKRALTRVVASLADKVSFGLVTFSQSGYYRYWQAGTGTTPTSIFLDKWEMKHLEAWDVDHPAATFTWNGTTFTLLSGAGLTATKDSLYARTDNTSEETRGTWSMDGDAFSAGGFNWVYRGSYYVYQRRATTATTSTPSTYMGPQYVSGATTWVYRPFRWEGDWFSGQNISSSTSGMVAEAIEPDPSEATQKAKTFRIMTRLNEMNHGGLLSLGYTPTGPAINVAAQHFLDRHNGTGPFVAVGQDPLRDCRKRAAIVVTDGEHNQGENPWLSSQNLYNNTTFAGNEIKVMAVGIPGMSSTSTAGLEVRRIADAGDDGTYNYSNPTSPYAYFPTTETQLVSDLSGAIAEAVSGDFVTSAAGASTSGSNSTTGDWAILPSTEIPGWLGHLRAFDMTQASPTEEWDAATELNNLSNPYARRIFTGHPGVKNPSKYGDPVELLDSSGNLISGTKVKDCASGAGSTTVGALDDTTLQTFLRWVYGQSRAHRLGPIIRCTPATIGPPSESYDALKDHAAFTSANASRETLIYVTSNEGLIHAFRTGKQADGGGTEVFAFMAPNLLDKAYALYLAGGQDSSPDSFRWILAAPPRVDDVLGEGDDDGNGWFTQLVVAMGPYNHGLVALDVTNPTDCSSSPCSLRSRPFNVRALHYTNAGGDEETAWNGSNSSAPNYLGEGWSVPSLYWEATDPNNPKFHMSAGTGYGAPTSPDMYKTSTTKGHYYFWWDHGQHVGKHSIGGNEIPKYLHDPAGLTLKVDAAVLADSAAAIDDDSAPGTIIATYQADLEGRLVRFTLGDPNATPAPWAMVGPDTSNPFYYSPAVMHLGGKQVVLAFNSGSIDEATPPDPDIESTIYLRAETNGTMDPEYDLTCAVSAIMGGCGGNLDVSGITDWGTWPTTTAKAKTLKPVGTPLLVLNNPGSGERVEAFYLLYEPGSSGVSCTSGAGTSWLLRISVDSAGTTNTLEEVVPTTGRAGGITLLGGGSRVALSKSSTGSPAAATMDNLNNPVSGSAGGTNPASLEYWREVK